MLKHLCVLHRFESEILARPTCEELEQRTAHATARELGRRCNPTNGADEIPSDSITKKCDWPTFSVGVRKVLTVLNVASDAKSKM